MSNAKVIDNPGEYESRNGVRGDTTTVTGRGTV